MTGWARPRLAVAALLILTLAGLAHAADALKTRTAVRLQLKWLHQAQFAGYYAAKERGYYAREGLDVTILPGGPAIAPESVVDAGNAELGVGWLSALLVARDQGMPLVNIAQIFQESGMRLVTFKTSGIESVEDFAGKRVGVWPSGNEYQFLALMSEYGMSPPQDHLTVVDQPFDITPFLVGDLDVAHAMTYNELETVFEEAGRDQVRIFDYNDLGVSILEDGLFAREDWLTANPAVAQRFLRASIRGWQWAVANPKAAGKMSFRYAGPATPGGLGHQVFMARAVARLVKAGLSKKRPIGFMNPNLYDRTWTTLLSQGVISRQPEGAYDQAYWRKATR